MKLINGRLTLTVGELIEKLQKFRKTRKVLVHDDNGKNYNIDGISGGNSHYKNCLEITTEGRID